jgi:hypothetical protein
VESEFLSINEAAARAKSVQRLSTTGSVVAASGRKRGFADSAAAC